MASKRSRQAFEADQQQHASPFVLYGAALPVLDEHSRDDGSFVPVWKQEVRDERGRKRLHGAFTGGFSAGYFNTVGSKEGWTPSTFVSSRKNRAKDKEALAAQRPEDFMDDEDLQEAEESRTLQTSVDFAGFGTEQDDRRRFGAIDIFIPSGETVGTKLLKKMGWKEGQGIGPRVRRVANLEEDGSSAETHLFAPDDIKVISLSRKNDCKGLGYEAELDQLSVISNGQTGRATEERDCQPVQDDEAGLRLGVAQKSVKRSKKAGFGVGILNESDDDDDDPYSMGPRISYNRVIGGEKKTKKKSHGLASANPSLKSKPAFLSKKLASLRGVLKKCHDGRLPPDGFVLADAVDAFGSMSISDDKYRPPERPPDWKSSLARDVEESNVVFVSAGDAAKSSNLSAKSRASLLGEAQLPGKSVFDFMSPAARDRLVNASGKTDLPRALNEPPPPGHESKTAETSLLSLVPDLDTQTALQALNRGVGGFMPYSEDEDKRTRYRTYLEIQAGLRNADELPPRAAGMRQEDWVLEMQEFARAAQVFKPVSGLMATRFTSGSAQIAGQNPDTENTDLLFKPRNKAEDPAISAAKMGMFGPMTRSIQTFAPTRLLCKRFGVSMPDVSGLKGAQHADDVSPVHPTSMSFPHDRTTSSDVQTSALAAMEAPQHPGEPPPAPRGNGGDVASTDPSISVRPDQNEALEQERPGEAVFKAIFGDSDDDDD